MDYQPKYKAQTTIDANIFADGRAARLPVPGTVSRSGLTSEGPAIRDALHLGYSPEEAETFETALLQDEGGEEGASDDSSDEATSDEETTETETAENDASNNESDSDDTTSEPAGDASAAPVAYVYPWVEEFPDEIEVNQETVERGRQRYDIYCAVCHGLAGDGDGLIAQRALQLEQPTWRPPTSLHLPNVAAQPVGKLYDTITNGNLAGKTENGGIMRGGMAGYKQQISLEDRWAIVLYVKALQKTRTATPGELSEEELASLK